MEEEEARKLSREFPEWDRGARVRRHKYSELRTNSLRQEAMILTAGTENKSHHHHLLVFTMCQGG